MGTIQPVRNWAYVPEAQGGIAVHFAFNPAKHQTTAARIEPRARRRRPKDYPHLHYPRDEARTFRYAKG